MIDYSALKTLFGTDLPDASTFFATKGVRNQGITYARLRREFGKSSSYGNRRVWKLFVEKYKEETSTVAVTGVTVAPKTATVKPGETVQLNSTVAPSTATNKDVTYTSSKPETATVSSVGLVTVLSGATPEDTVTITVTTADGNKTDTSVITVGTP